MNTSKLNQLKSSGQLGSIVISLKSTALDLKEQQLLSHKNIAGVILFTRNFKDQEQLIQLTTAIKKINNNIIIMVDHEGGAIWRFKDRTFPNPGDIKQLGELYDNNPHKALDTAYSFGYQIAISLKQCGIDLNLAPVLDLGIKNANNSYISSIIGNLGRAIHNNPKIVATIAANFIYGQKMAGIISVGKHFPGHGSIETDTHCNLSIDERNQEEIFNLDLAPFKLLIKGDPNLNLRPNILEAIMPAHIIYPSISQQPASCSKVWLQEILRNQLGFNGIIISDCLSMAAVQQFIEQQYNVIELDNIMKKLKINKTQSINLILTKQALQAGCDLIIFNNLYDTNLENLLNNIDLY